MEKKIFSNFWRKIYPEKAREKKIEKFEKKKFQVKQPVLRISGTAWRIFKIQLSAAAPTRQLTFL